jgi:hypothetical protein
MRGKEARGRALPAVGGLLGLAAVAAAAALTFPTTAVSSPPTPPAATPTPQAPGIAVVDNQNFDLPDPMFVTAGGRYHVFFSTAFGDASLANIPEEAGSPGHWRPERDALPILPGWARPAAAGGRTWDPYVQKIHGSYLLYFAAQLRRVPRSTHCLGVARSASPDGPFVPVGDRPVVCQPSEGGEIDVQPFYDPAGPQGADHPWYLLWKSDGNNLLPHQPTAIWSAPLSNDGLRITGAARVIFRGDQPWERPVLEAPQIVRSPDGRVWLFFSAGQGFYTPDYAIGVARCDGPLGGCHTYGSGPLVASNTQGDGPGEQTVFVGPDRSYWLVYNPWHTGLPYMLYRPAEAVRIGWDKMGPYVAEAGRFPSPVAPTGPPRPPLTPGVLR